VEQESFEILEAGQQELCTLLQTHCFFDGHCYVNHWNHQFIYWL